MDLDTAHEWSSWAFSGPIFSNTWKTPLSVFNAGSVLTASPLTLLSPGDWTENFKITTAWVAELFVRKEEKHADRETRSRQNTGKMTENRGLTRKQEEHSISVPSPPPVAATISCTAGVSGLSWRPQACNCKHFHTQNFSLFRWTYLCISSLLTGEKKKFCRSQYQYKTTTNQNWYRNRYWYRSMSQYCAKSLPYTVYICKVASKEDNAW